MRPKVCVYIYVCVCVCVCGFESGITIHLPFACSHLYGVPCLLTQPESFILFSQPLPSLDLGFVDSRATDVTVTVGEREYSIEQSPGLLNSSRKGGTTGAGESETFFFFFWLVISMVSVHARC